MKLAYVDESGDGGMGVGGSSTFCLSCLLVDSQAWPDTFDGVLAYRRYLRRSFGLPIRSEVKAQYMLHNRGPLTGLNLGDDIRFRMYRGFMRLQAKLGIQAFAIVIRKRVLSPSREPVSVAWEFLLQRLERSAAASGRPVLLLHDEGEQYTVRKLARKARRAGSAGSAFGTSSLRRPFRLLIEDPIAKRSEDSYFIQLADLNAYAAFRHVVPPPRETVITADTWNELAEARLIAVNGVRGGPPGIVVYP